MLKSVPQSGTLKFYILKFAFLIFYVAGPGIAPGSGAYETPEILLLYPAIKINFISITKNLAFSKFCKNYPKKIPRILRGILNFSTNYDKYSNSFNAVSMLPTARSASSKEILISEFFTIRSRIL